MTAETKRYIARAIITHLDGDMDRFNELAKQAMELYKQDKHLYVSIEDVIKAKGEIA